MAFAQVAADDEGAREQLRSVAWLLGHLERRRDALVVALRDRGAASWTDLVKLTDPEEPEPARKRSAMQRRYEAGRRRAGLPVRGVLTCQECGREADVEEMPDPFTTALYPERDDHD